MEGHGVGRKGRQGGIGDGAREESSYIVRPYEQPVIGGAGGGVRVEMSVFPRGPPDGGVGVRGQLVVVGVVVVTTEASRYLIE